MTIDYAADLNELLSADGHGVLVRRDDDSAFTGYLDREFVVQTADLEPGVGSIGPALTAKTSDLEALREGARLRFYSTDSFGQESLTDTFKVKTEHEPDGHGLSIIQLRI